MELRRIALLVVVVGLGGCGTSSPVGPTEIPEGSWGSLTTGMIVTSSGAVVEFCCAEGTIPPPLTVDPSGAFNLQGTYRGPGRFSVPATYAGVLNGATMRLTVTAPPNVDQSVTLVLGRQPTVLCECPFIPASR